MTAHAWFDGVGSAGATISSDQRRQLCADLAVLTVVAMVMTLFAVSEVTLEHFSWHYIDSGGNALTKVHPATFLAVAALGLRCLSTNHPWRTGARLLTRGYGSVLLLVATFAAAVAALFVAGTPVTGLIDTFLFPVLVFVLLVDLDPIILRWIAMLVAGMLCLNAVLAIIEFQRGIHFLTIDVPSGATADPTRADATFDWRAQMAQEWRAMAMLGHPLVNALIVGCLIICLASDGSRWMPVPVKAVIAPLQIVAMFAFGARGPLVFSLAVASVLGMRQIVDALRKGVRLTPRVIAITLLGIASIIAMIGVLESTGFLDRTLERFSSDQGSAKARLTMFALFEPLSWSDLILGPDQGLVATWQRLEGLEFGVESAWVGLALTYGLVVTAMLIVGLAAFAGSIINASGRGAFALVAYYFVSISFTTSLAGKTTNLAMLVVMALVFLPKQGRGVGPCRLDVETPRADRPRPQSVWEGASSVEPDVEVAQRRVHRQSEPSVYEENIWASVPRSSGIGDQCVDRRSPNGPAGVCSRPAEDHTACSI